MYAERILARTQYETTALNQLGKQGQFSAGSGSIIGILWRIATGEVLQIHFLLTWLDPFMSTLSIYNNTIEIKSERKHVQNITYWEMTSLSNN